MTSCLPSMPLCHWTKPSAWGQHLNRPWSEDGWSHHTDPTRSSSLYQAGTLKRVTKCSIITFALIICVKYSHFWQAIFDTLWVCIWDIMLLWNRSPPQFVTWIYYVQHSREKFKMVTYFSKYTCPTLAVALPSVLLGRAVVLCWPLRTGFSAREYLLYLWSNTGFNVFFDTWVFLLPDLLLSGNKYMRTYGSEPSSEKAMRFLVTQTRKD